MPETYILYRYFFEHTKRTEQWWHDFNNLDQKKKEAEKIIEKNDFVNIDKLTNDKIVIKFIKEHYLISREEMINPDSAIYKEKLEYDNLKSSVNL